MIHYTQYTAHCKIHYTKYTAHGMVHYTQKVRVKSLVNLEIKKIV